MRSAGALLLVMSVSAISLLADVHTASGHEGEVKRHARVLTDGRLRPGHRETIRVKGFPGKGVVDISFFPTAICEEECGGRGSRGELTNAKGAGKFRVRIPQTFINERGGSTYFRNHERIKVLVSWEGSNEGFDIASAEPEPMIVRVHGSHRHG